MTFAPLLERSMTLPDRGTTFIREAVGPPGAPVLLLLHGLAATGGLNWRPAFGPLAHHFRVIALDHRGHGRGIATRSHFRLADCADDAAALLEALGLERAIAVGYSMGGPIAQLLWHRHRARVEGLVLCATACRFARRDRRRAVRRFSWFLNVAGRFAPRSALRALARDWLSEAIPSEAIRTRILLELAGTDPIAVAQAGAALARFSSRAWIGEVDVPTAVVVTELDELVPERLQLQLAEAIPGATVHRVAGDHRVCVAQPDRFVPVLRQACLSVAERVSGSARRGAMARP